MTEPSTYLYEPYTGRLENGREVLVQIFRNPDDGTVIVAQLTFRQIGGVWGPPYTLEIK
jgi:hypothetical protein